MDYLKYKKQTGKSLELSSDNFYNIKNAKIYKNENGEKHRDDGPAVEWNDGEVWYFKNGLLHREDGPAKIKTNGDTEWYINGKRHREDGPAIEKKIPKRQYWYLNGKLHRLDGPAVILETYDEVFYYINGVLLNYNNWKKQSSQIKLQRIKNL